MVGTLSLYLTLALVALRYHYKDASLATTFILDSSTHIGQIPMRSRIIMFSDGKGTLDIKTSGDDGFESPLDFLVEHIFLDYEITKYAFLDFFEEQTLLI